MRFLPQGKVPDTPETQQLGGFFAFQGQGAH
jgi:hypothetical protein